MLSASPDAQPLSSDQRRRTISDTHGQMFQLRRRPPDITLTNLGDWIDAKRTGRAGREIMWQGWFRFQERVDTYLAARDFLDEPEM